VYLSGLHVERDALQNFPIAYSGVQIIYLEHETSD
jgi:hypothetical protein